MTKLTNVLLIVTVLLAVAVLPAGAARLFGLVDTGELFVSDNGGVNWSVQSTLAVSDAIAIAAGESSDELFLATEAGLIYRSTDAGMNWTAVGSVSASDVIDMAIRTNGDLYLLSKTGTLWRSTDDGANFTALAALTASNYMSLTGRAGGGDMYALTETGEVARSTDFGTTWNVVGVVTTPDAVEIRSVGLDLYVLTGTGNIAESTDKGATWIMIGTISQVNMTALTLNGTDLVAASKEGLVATSGDAMSWSFPGSINQLNVVAIGNDSPTVTGIGPQAPPISPLRVRSVWPNPVGNSGTPVAVQFELATSDQVGLRVYNVAGILVRSTAPRAFSAGGPYTLEWNTTGLPSGVYFLRLSTEAGLTAQTKLTVIR